ASIPQLVADVAGFFGGLVIAALLSIPFALLPDPLRQVLPLLSVIIFSYMGVMIANTHYRELFGMLNFRMATGKVDNPAPADTPHGNSLLLDTSVIIDGRIVDIHGTGFLRGELVVPRFVLNELHHISDSADGMRRARGRRGLEVLKHLQKDGTQVQIVDEDPEQTKEVDEKLVLLAKEWRCAIVTNDYNLNKVASLQGVTVLNVNELANAVKSALLPGEMLTVRVIQEGKETGQGVGYLDDGTMVVIEEGRSHLNQTLHVTVTKVLQTAAGRMIFAKP
ncbi:MAG TPA: TRAM domain-containing protein, partial [Anaerolineae bacterium]